MNSNIFRIIVFFVVLLTLPLLTLSNKEIDFKNLEAENIKIFFSENIEVENFKTYKNGVGCYAVVNQNQVNKFLSADCLSGLSFESKQSYKNILKNLNAKIVSVQNIEINEENKTIVYAFSNNFHKFMIVNGQKVNVQIAVGNEKAVVGLPLLLGSY